MNKLLPLLTLFPLLSIAAEVTEVKDARSFDYVYTMDKSPTSLDLDGNGVEDWHGETCPEVSGGFATNSAEVTAGNGTQLYRGDSIVDDKPYVFLSVNDKPDAAWTFEIKVAKVAGGQGSKGWFGVAAANKNESNSSKIWIKDDRVTVADKDYLIGSDFTTGHYHTIRMTHAAEDNAMFYWVDGILLNKDLQTPIRGKNGSGFDDAIFIGDYSMDISGFFSIDSMSLTKGAFSPTEQNKKLLATSVTKSREQRAIDSRSSLVQIGGINLTIVSDE